MPRVTFKRFLVVIVATPILVTASLFLLKSRMPILFTWSTGECSCNPQKCLGNPFRDPTPEHLAESLLDSLKQKQITNLTPLLSPKETEHFCNWEIKCPIKSWRLGDRVDYSNSSSLTYWVTRGGSYPDDLLPIFISVKRSPAWCLESYGAVY